MEFRTIIRACALAFSLLAGCSREGQIPVAIVGTNVITADDFRVRYKKFLESSGVRDNIVQRKSVLQNMINEQLVLDQRKREGWFDRPDVKKRMEEIRLQALLDRYAVKLIADTVTVTEQELRKEFRDANAKVNVRYLYAKTEAEAWDLKKKLNNGATFEKLAKLVFDDPGLANNGGHLGYFGRGEMDERLEEVAFSLSPGLISDPVKIGIGYAIVKVEDRVDHPLLTESDYARQRAAIEEKVKRKKGIQAIEKTVHTIAKDLSAQFNEPLLNRLYEQWDELTSGSRREIAEQTVAAGSVRDTELVRFGKQAWSVTDFLEKLEYTTSRQRQRVKTLDDLRTIILGLAARDVLIRRAKESGVEHDPETQGQIEQITLQYVLREWSSEIYRRAIEQPLDEEAIRKFYDDRKSEFMVPPEVNVAEILVRTRREADDLRQQIDRGADFGALARRFSIRIWAAKKGGELGFGTIQKFGPLGEQFMKAPVGTILGPEFVDPYYGVFKILGKKPARQKRLDECRPEIVDHLRKQLELELRGKAMQELRKAIRISVDEIALGNVKL